MMGCGCDSRGLKGNQQGTIRIKRIKNSWAIVGPSRGRGAPMLLVSSLGSREYRNLQPLELSSDIVLLPHALA